MPKAELRQLADRLQSQADAASLEHRLRLLPEVNRVVIQFKAQGMEVPKRLSALNDELTQDAIEARFDNLPV